MKNIWIVIMIIIFLVLVGSCSDSKKDPYSGYSDTYKSSSSYRKDVKGISDAFGVSEREVNRKIIVVIRGK